MIYAENNKYVLQCDCCGSYRLRFKTAKDVVDYLVDMKWSIDKNTGEDSSYNCPVCRGRD